MTNELTVPDDLKNETSPLALERTSLDLRQERRLGKGTKASGTELFDPRLAYELALEMWPAAEVFDRYGYDEKKAVKLLAQPTFLAAVKTYKREISESGAGFKLKAKVQAEYLLQHSFDIATDPETPPSVRADLIKWTAAVAELGPKAKGEGGGAGAGFSLNITFGGPAPAAVRQSAVIDVVPTREDS